MTRFAKREQIYSYVAPDVTLFAARYALVFGTSHGVQTFANDISFLYGRRFFERIIISGGVTRSGAASEASMVFQPLVRCGVPPQAILWEDKARNTGENVAFSRALVHNLNVTELFLIGKVSSKRRYMMTVKKQWPEIKRMCCYGVNYFSCDPKHWWREGDFRRRVMNEYRKIPSYIESGFISEISIRDGVVT